MATTVANGLSRDAEPADPTKAGSGAAHSTISYTGEYLLTGGPVAAPAAARARAPAPVLQGGGRCLGRE